MEPRDRATQTRYADDPDAGILRPVFVGRAAELAELTGRIAMAADGRGGLLLLSGPAGIGKTRTVEEAVTGAGAGRLPSPGAGAWTTPAHPRCGRGAG